MSNASHEDLIKDAWGVCYSTDAAKIPKFYLCDYKGTFRMKNDHSIVMTSKCTVKQHFINIFNDQKLFKIKRYEGKGDRGDIKIMIEPPGTAADVDVNDVWLDKKRTIKSGRCKIKLIEEDEREIVFEAFCDVSKEKNLILIDDKYRIINYLGKGTYGSVYKGFDIKNETFCAIKTLHKPNSLALHHENSIFQNLRHDSFIKVLDFIDIDHYSFLITEFAEGGSLHYRINYGPAINETESRTIFRQVFDGIYYLHRHNILHRNLKPENIVLMTDGENPVAKIIDFGASSYDTDFKKVRVGSYRYVAPEVLRKKLGIAAACEYTDRMDIWGLGVCLFMTLTKSLPFAYNTDPNQYLETMMKGKMNTYLRSYEKLSEKTKNVLINCLLIDPTQRPSMPYLVTFKWP